MTLKNTVLLIIRQSPGIDYNSLLGKISSTYSNVNSARAALSRLIKDLLIFGFVVRQNNNFFVTDKAQALLSAEMKNKLVLKINEHLKSAKIENIEPIVETLSTLIERSRHDDTLLKAAKTSSDFYISDLEELANNTNKKISHLAYIEKILRDQINALKEMNFNEVKKTSFENSKDTIIKIANENNFEEVTVEIYPQTIKEILSEKLSLKFKDHSTTIKKEHLQNFFIELQKQEFSAHEITVFLPPVKAKVGLRESFFVGPYSSINTI